MVPAGFDPSSWEFLARPDLFDRVWIDGRIYRSCLVVEYRAALASFNLYIYQPAGDHPIGELVRPRVPERMHPSGSADHCQLSRCDQYRPVCENTGTFHNGLEINRPYAPCSLEYNSPRPDWLALLVPTRIESARPDFHLDIPGLFRKRIIKAY